MQLTQLLEEDDAVSPVIGVILMVAVTVILAAVIASFVLGLGSGVDSTPQASFAVEFNPNGNEFQAGVDDGNITITHDGGDTLDNSTVSVVVDGNEATTGSWPDAEITAGDSYTIDETGESFDIVSGDEVRVVWKSPDSDKTGTLYTAEAP